MTRKTCRVTAIADLHKTNNCEKGSIQKLRCCLFAPHPGYNHWDPRLLLTCGGETIKLKGWSYWNCGKK